MNGRGTRTLPDFPVFSIMPTDTARNEWDVSCKETLARLSPLLAGIGYALDDEQPHITGERFLTRPIDGGRKLVLIGRRVADGQKAIIKVSDEPRGIEELEYERACRDALKRIPFAYQAFYAPRELAFVRRGGFVILVSEFIEQEMPFIERTVEEQFSLALGAFKAQEGAHATTYEHRVLVTRTFGEMYAQDYLANFARFRNEILAHVPDKLVPEAVLTEATKVLAESRENLERYGGFLTHWDFTPQNFRVKDGRIYLLDLSSLRFGNKYEGWARFINFMMLYNPKLADALVQYVAENRTEEESLALKAMRIYRLGEILLYYVYTLSRSSGALHELNSERIRFWTRALATVVHDEHIPPEVLERYRDTRDRLRSDEEKRRQVGLH